MLRSQRSTENSIKLLLLPHNSSSIESFWTDCGVGNFKRTPSSAVSLAAGSATGFLPVDKSDTKTRSVDLECLDCKMKYIFWGQKGGTSYSIRIALKTFQCPVLFGTVFTRKPKGAFGSWWRGSIYSLHFRSILNGSILYGTSILYRLAMP
jgi:hypothetical protein